MALCGRCSISRVAKGLIALPGVLGPVAGVLCSVAGALSGVEEVLIVFKAELVGVEGAVIAPVLYMRKTPNRVSGMGAFKAADKPRAKTRRVSRGSIMPSSQRRAVA